MWVELGGAKIHVNKTGEGPPVLLIHGVPDSAQMWSPVMASLQNRFTCYAPDLPGFNGSQIPEDFEFSLEGYGRFVNRLIDALGIESPVGLVLHDWGGIFGMSFACQFPEKVRSITGGSFPFTARYHWHTWARIWRTPMLGEMSMLMMNKVLFSWESKRSSPHLSQAHINETYAKLNRHTKQTILKLYRSFSPEVAKVFETRLHALSHTVEITSIWGADDIYVNPRYASYMRPRQQLVLENCGHWVPVQAPLFVANAVR